MHGMYYIIQWCARVCPHYIARLVPALTEFRVAVVLPLALQGHLDVRTLHHRTPTALDRVSQCRIRRLRVPPSFPPYPLLVRRGVCRIVFCELRNVEKLEQVLIR